MHGQVKPCIAIDERPCDHHEGEHAISHQETEEHGDAECVGGVGRKETVVKSTLVVDHMDHIFDQLPIHYFHYQRYEGRDWSNLYQNNFFQH